jgi:ATP-binding cassette subfamily A (ABC1) protein 3
MKIMGLNDTPYYASWITHYIAVFGVIALLCAIGLKIGPFPFSNIFMLFIWLWLFYIFQMARAVFFSSFFTKAKWGVTLGIVLYFIEEMIILIGVNES